MYWVRTSLNEICKLVTIQIYILKFFTYYAIYSLRKIRIWKKWEVRVVNSAEKYANEDANYFVISHLNLYHYAIDIMLNGTWL